MRPDSLVIDGGGSGVDHMRRDTELLHRCAAGDIAAAIRLYWFDPPCLSLGRLEPIGDVDLDACTRDGIDVVRRPSGGRAVLHDDEVTYAVVCRADDPDFGGDVMTSCCRIHEAVAAGLMALGIATTPHAASPMDRRAARKALAAADCFARPAGSELLDQFGAKLVGSAQARRGGALLQHGSVLLSASRAGAYLDAQAGTGDPAIARPVSPGLRALAGRDITREEVASALAAGFRRTICAQPLDTTA